MNEYDLSSSIENAVLKLQKQIYQALKCWLHGEVCMTNTKLERSRMWWKSQVRFWSRVGRGDFLHLDNN